MTSRGDFVTLFVGHGTFKHFGKLKSAPSSILLPKTSLEEEGPEQHSTSTESQPEKTALVPSTRLTVPRSVRRDVRLETGSKFSSVMNSGEEWRVYGFLRSHAHPRCKLRDRVKACYGLPCHPAVVGCAEIAKEFLRGHDDIPDLVGCLLRCQLVTLPGGKQKLILSTRLLGNKIIIHEPERESDNMAPVTTIVPIDVVINTIFTFEEQLFIRSITVLCQPFIP